MDILIALLFAALLTGGTGALSERPIGHALRAAAGAARNARSTGATPVAAAKAAATAGRDAHRTAPRPVDTSDHGAFGRGTATVGRGATNAYRWFRRTKAGEAVFRRPYCRGCNNTTREADGTPCRYCQYDGTFEIAEPGKAQPYVVGENYTNFDDVARKYADVINNGGSVFQVDPRTGKLTNLNQLYGLDGGVKAFLAADKRDAAGRTTYTTECRHDGCGTKVEWRGEDVDACMDAAEAANWVLYRHKGVGGWYCPRHRADAAGVAAHKPPPPPTGGPDPTDTAPTTTPASPTPAAATPEGSTTPMTSSTAPAPPPGAIETLPDYQRWLEATRASATEEHEDASAGAGRHLTLMMQIADGVARLAAVEVDAATVGEGVAVKEAAAVVKDKSTELAAALAHLVGTITKAQAGVQRQALSQEQANQGLVAQPAAYAGA